MAFATRADLLARSNAMRLAQLAVPADMLIPPDEALRVAIAGGSLAGYTPAEQAALTAALAAIDLCLADADALLISYGIPDTVQNTLLARLAATVALYYLQGAERMTDEVAQAYHGVLDLLKAYRKGDVDMIPSAPSPDDAVEMVSSPRRYGLS